MKSCVITFLLLVVAAQGAKWTDLRSIGPLKVNKLTNEIQSSNRIVSGSNAEVGQFPHQVALILDGVGVCGGTLISQDIVLTAAHCLDGFITVEASFGAHGIYDFEETGRVNIITRDLNFHDNYDLFTITYDIGFVRLPEQVTLSPTIQLVRLPSHSQNTETFEGQNSIVSGWGVYNSTYPEISPVLKYAEMTVISNTECEPYYPAGFIIDQMICASPVTGNFCNSDSGGPLSVTESDGIVTQVGINSFRAGVNCENSDPGGFVRVTYFLDWIEINSGVVIRP